MSNRFIHVFRLLAKNLRFLLTVDLREQQRKMQKQHAVQQDQLLCNSITTYYAVHGLGDYQSEVRYLLEHGLDVFPYVKIKELGCVQSGFDTSFQLAYVIHNGKRLYFPTDSPDRAVSTYKRFVERECILGSGYAEKMPHSYISDRFSVHKGDVLLDIGAAEALFTLEHIDIVHKAYIFEPNEKWVKPLRATFSRYEDKVVIINKLVSDHVTPNAVTLSSVFDNKAPSNLFVKMDVEGYEQTILNSSMDFLSQATDLRIACCTYHRQNDAVVIADLFEKAKLHYEFSDGYMIFKYDPQMAPPFFRRGMIRGWNHD